ncbi:hypothetical protein HanXRQr2_Chr15g0686941 [Helianthus annuus]|uniref:Uncharacterized protein n=2 Tax=Helianthus annuus TaxID=4232 RepID=A0A9K3DZJ9_HELAN|nr:hypothetical protein HanXRQr2_Chr15g0686941 [Helianthus annuus]KAJ0830746.1 hypothetical protein HanPSC8_Chr15g0658961 [Helianthus annuus]
MCHFFMLGSIPEKVTGTSGTVDMSVEPMMVDPVSIFDGTSLVENLGFYREETIMTNKERVLAELEAGRRNPARDKSIAYVNRSPYFRRGVDINEEISKVDKCVWEYIRNNETTYYNLHGDSSRREVMKVNLERGQAWAKGFTNEEYRANPRAEELLYRSSAYVEAT